MIKKLTIFVMILTLLFVASCGTAETYTDSTENDDCSSGSYCTFIDEEADVICYWRKIGYGAGLSCLPIKDTELKR